MATTRHVTEIARALIKAAQRADAVPQIVAETEAVGEAFQTDPGLRAALRERALPLAARSKALRAAWEKDVHLFFLNALLSLQHADLLEEYPAFQTAVNAAALEIAGHYEIRVCTAVALKPDEKKKLEQTLEKKIKGTHRLREAVDPGILGGMVVDIGSRRIDASLRGKIDRLQRHMTKEQLTSNYV